MSMIMYWLVLYSCLLLFFFKRTLKGSGIKKETLYELYVLLQRAEVRLCRLFIHLITVKKPKYDSSNMSAMKLKLDMWSVPVWRRRGCSETPSGTAALPARSSASSWYLPPVGSERSEPRRRVARRLLTGRAAPPHTGGRRKLWPELAHACSAPGRIKTESILQTQIWSKRKVKHHLLSGGCTCARLWMAAASIFSSHTQCMSVSRTWYSVSPNQLLARSWQPLMLTGSQGRCRRTSAEDPRDSIMAQGDKQTH